MSIDFTGVEQVISDDLRFKRQLRIGRDAFTTLRSVDALKTVAGSAGAAWGGATIAGSTMVASTFFPATGILGWLGLATAATPIGWVVAAAVAAGGAFYLATNHLSSSDRFVDEIPKFISTPLDLLGASLFELLGTLAVAVARSDGDFDPLERKSIIEHFVLDWGYDHAFAHAALANIENHSDEVALTVIASKLAEFQSANPDCNAEAMQKEMMRFLRELIAVDGIITDAEIEAVRKVESALSAHRKPVIDQKH